MRLNAARLRLARYNRGLTQRALAARVGLTNGYISELECGEANGSPKSLKLIADELGVTVEYLLTPDDGVTENEEGQRDGSGEAAACG